GREGSCARECEERLVSESDAAGVAVTSPGALAVSGSREAVVVADRAQRVTLYEDRAEVRRRAEVRIAAGATWVALVGITPYIDDRSVQARLEGAPEGASVASARVVRRLVLPHEFASQEIAA